MKEKTVIIHEKGGKVVNIYPSIREVSRVTGMHVSTIKWRVERGEQVKGEVFRTLTHEEELQLRAMTIEFLNRGQKEKSGTIQGSEITKGIEMTNVDDQELDGVKYSIVDYETIAKRVCITPCPYLESPKPMVGSVLCLSCESFRGRNRSTQQVACCATWENQGKKNKKL